MKTDLVLGAKYRVVKGDYSVVGILTHIEMDMSDYIELTKEGGLWESSCTAVIYGPWDLIEQEMK